MPNPVASIRETGRPFVYFHTHVFTPDVLDLALRSGTSLEVDISVHDDGGLFVGHPRAFYDFKKIPVPDNLPLEPMIDALEASDLFVVLDCKDLRALPAIHGFIERLGPDRTLFHSWIDHLLFEPFAPSIVREPHWPLENLPVETVAELSRQTGVPVVASARGLTLERLRAERSDIVERVVALEKYGVRAVGFTLPGGVAPPTDIAEELLGHGMLTAINVDVTPPEALPRCYLGSTDDLARATPFARGAEA